MLFTKQIDYSRKENFGCCEVYLCKKSVLNTKSTAGNILIISYNLLKFSLSIATVFGYILILRAS